jgi:hypothetical protein
LLPIGESCCRAIAEPSAIGGVKVIGNTVGLVKSFASVEPHLQPHLGQTHSIIHLCTRLSNMDKSSLSDKFGLILEHWRPEVVAQLNGQELKLVKFHGIFPWHHREYGTSCSSFAPAG